MNLVLTKLMAQKRGIFNAPLNSYDVVNQGDKHYASLLDK